MCWTSKKISGAAAGLLLKNVKSEGKIVNNWKEKGRLLRKEQCNVNLSNKCEVARAAQSFELAPKLKFPPTHDLYIPLKIRFPWNWIDLWNKQKPHLKRNPIMFFRFLLLLFSNFSILKIRIFVLVLFLNYKSDYWKFKFIVIARCICWDMHIHI